MVLNLGCILETPGEFNHSLMPGHCSHHPGDSDMRSRLGVTAVVEQWSRGACLFVSAKYSRNLNVMRILANRSKKLSYQLYEGEGDRETGEGGRSRRRRRRKIEEMGREERGRERNGAKYKQWIKLILGHTGILATFL